MKRTREEIDRCYEICKEAHSQLFWSIDRPTYWSWGVSKLNYCYFNDMPTLCMKVNGFLHTGWVYVSLDEGADTYEVRLLDLNKTEVKCINDVYCESLGTIIDGLVEKAPGITSEMYGELVNREYQ